MKVTYLLLFIIAPLLCWAQKPSVSSSVEKSTMGNLESKSDGFWYSKTPSGRESPLKIDPKANNLTVYETIANLRASTLTVANAITTINITDSGKEGFFVLDPNDRNTLDNMGTTVVTRSGLRYKRVVNGSVSVRWFGAKGDGSDDTNAIQSAINFATEFQNPAKDGAFSSKWKGRDLTVYLPMGIYKLSKTVHVKGTIKLQGSAGGAYAGSQLIQGVAGISMLSLDAGTDGISNATVIEDLIFKSGSAVQNPNIAQIIIGTSNGNSNYIRNCWFQTPENLAIWITKGGDVQISGCTFDVLPFQAIAIGKSGVPPVIDVSIVNNTFFEVALDIIRIYSAKGITVSGNRISNSVGSKHNTTFINGTGADIITSLAITGNEYTNVSNFLHLPINLFGCSVVGNTGYNTNGYFIKISQSGIIYGVSIMGNSVFSSAADKENKLIDVSSNAAFQGTSIVGNSFYGTAVKQTNVVSMPNSNNINNEIANNSFTNFTTPYAVHSPEQNGIFNFKTFISTDSKSANSGDLLYYNGAIWTRLSKGAEGQILKMVSGKPTWVTP